jgi:hypothetical protein
MTDYAIDITGKTFGRLTVVSRVENSPEGKAKWRCLCTCGKSTVSVGGNLRLGKSRSCGCLRTETMIQKNGTHLLSDTLEYKIWHGMRRRCFNPDNRGFKDYGGRGITVCDRWRDSFENFIADVGFRPSRSHSIDRINNDGNYEPGNCKWSTSIGEVATTSILPLNAFNAQRLRCRKRCDDVQLHRKVQRPSQTIQHRDKRSVLECVWRARAVH